MEKEYADYLLTQYYKAKNEIMTAVANMHNISSIDTSTLEFDNCQEIVCSYAGEGYKQFGNYTPLVRTQKDVYATPQSLY